MNALRGMEHHLAALYESDERGRLVAARAPCPTPTLAPRFHLARTSFGNLWRLHCELDSALAIRLAALAGKEAPLGDPIAPPEREEFLRRALEGAAPIEASWSGPAFGLGAELAAPRDTGARIRALSSEDLRCVHPALGLSQAALERPGCIGAEVGGEIVAVCECARGDGRGPVEAGVGTAPEHRGRGHGLAVVRAWCDWVLDRGGVPIYSTSWDNEASRALATRLGLSLLGEDRHWR